MAHRSEITPVQADLRSERSTIKVNDPTCGMSLNPAEARHVLYRPEDTYYFCSKDCLQEFISPKMKKKSA